MILPDGKNKKYAEVVSGLYILYVILNPILGIDKNFSISDIQSTIVGNSIDSFVSQEEISRIYILGLENNLKAKIEEKGYQVDYIQFYITPDYSIIAKIEIKIKNGTNYDKEKITSLILENIDIGKSNINIF